MLNLHPSFYCYWDCKPNFNFSEDRKPNFNCYWCCKPNFNFSVNCKPNSNLSRNWKPQFYKNFLIMSLLLASDALKTWQCKLIFNQNIPGCRLDNVYQYFNQDLPGYNLNQQSNQDYFKILQSVWDYFWIQFEPSIIKVIFNQSEIISGYNSEPSINPRLF